MLSLMRRLKKPCCCLASRQQAFQPLPASATQPFNPVLALPDVQFRFCSSFPSGSGT